jgi:transglutaminase-like putative cysteine protease
MQLTKFQPFDRKKILSPNLGDVIRWMIKFAHQGKDDPVIRKLALDITKGLTSGDYAGEALAIYYWVCRNIRYVRDPHDVEYIASPRKVLEFGQADCDEIACLISALLMAVGNQTGFCVAAFSNPPVPSHVYCVVRTPDGKWIPLDPVANRESALMSRMATAKQIYVV